MFDKEVSYVWSPDVIGEIYVEAIYEIRVFIYVPLAPKAPDEVARVIDWTFD